MSDNNDSYTDTTSSFTDANSATTDSYTEVSEQSWLGRLFGSFVAALIGLILFLASFVVLYWNEGHAVAVMDSLNAGARTVISVPADSVNAANEGHLVHVTAIATVSGAPADPVLHLTKPTAMRLQRHVEMFQWQEHEESQTEKRVGGGETTRTTYTYRKAWSETPIDSSKFKQPNGHANPTRTLRSAVFDAAKVQLGAFRLDDSVVQQMSGFQQFVPPPDLTGAGIEPSFRRVGDQFYHGATPQTPDIGDMQVTYQVIDAQPVSVVAAQIGGTLAQYRGRDGRVIELVNLGTHSADDMFQEQKAAVATLTWILRGVGFAMMVIGLALMAAPLSWLASVLPFLEGVVDAAAFFAALIVAIPLTLTTIAIAWIVHRPLVGIGLIVVGVLLAIGVRWLVPRRRTGAPSHA